MRTDLDRFSTLEITSLVKHGYCVGRKACRTRPYLFGPNLLVAPVVEKGAVSREVHLPPGEWFDWWTGDPAPDRSFTDINASEISTTR